MFQKIIKVIMLHKITTAVIVLTVASGGYFGYAKLKSNATNEVRYVLAAVEKGTLITSISGSGQISVSNQVDIKPKASGDVLNVLVKNGQEVKAGDILVQLNTKDAYKNVRDAEANLESAQLSLDKLKKPASDYSIMQAENALTNAEISLEKLKLSQQIDYQNALEIKQSAEDNITKAYEDSFNTIADTFLDLPTIITNLNDILYSDEIVESGIIAIGDNISVLKNSVYFFNNYAGYAELESFINNAENDYDAAREKYDKNFDDYKNASRYSDQSTIESLLSETLETTKAIADATKSESNMLDYWVDYRSQFNYGTFSQVTEYQTDLGTYISQTNSHLSSLLSIQSTLQDNKNALSNAESDLAEMDQNNPLDLAAAEATVKDKEMALTNLKAGADPLDIQSQELSVKQRENALLDAREALADYTIRAPFDGVIAEINVKKGDTVSAGTAVATLITKQRLAEVSLNEVDVAKVKVDQKATLTFDAIDGLSITGEVADIDTLGTVTQGVVTYNVKIIFDTQDERVKPGMSVSASIITDMKQDVLLVTNSAVKTVGSASYVEMPDEEISSTTNATNNNEVILKKSPRQQSVQIGLANDSMTEIISGLGEGEQVVTQTITGNTTQTQSQNSRGFGIPGFGGGGLR